MRHVLIAHQFVAGASLSDSEDIRVGGEDPVSSEIFQPFAYTAWFPGEPSRNDKDGTPEFYLMLWYVQDYWSWNDQRDDVINDTGLSYFLGNTGYICEYED